MYHDAAGARLTDRRVIERIEALVIPPAWTAVWICSSANGHLQAVGTDSKGRRQYRYHDAWRAARDRAKFDRMVAFGATLPGLRGWCIERMLDGGAQREAALAAAVRLLDLGCFRIGSDRSAEENETFGLSTLERRHVHVRSPTIGFDYPGKGGVRQQATVVDELVADFVAVLLRRRSGGDRLLAWRDNPREGWRPIGAADVNAFIHEATGGPFSAKDFRTLRATVLAAGELGRAVGASSDAAHPATSGAAPSAASRKRTVAGAVRRVSGYLGNTPAVCRSSYIDPRVVDRYLAGHTVAEAGGDVLGLLEDPATDLTAAVPQAILECAVLGWLDERTGEDRSAAA